MDHITIRAVRSYMACTSFVDSLVGRVVDALDRNGYADNTVIVLWSDTDGIWARN